MEQLPIFSIAFAAVSLACLAALHFTSPEFAPSWRMISEYAMGRYKWLITGFFIFWGLSSLCLAAALWQTVTGGWAMFGVALLVVSGIGEIMGGLFDVKHNLHGLAFGLGVPTLPVAALILGYHLASQGGLDRGPVLLAASHATWISVALMGIAMGVMMSGFSKAGIPMNKDAPVPEKVPDGVIALAGYANRILVIAYVGWLVVVAAAIKQKIH
jgi:hypothetical protein